MTERIITFLATEITVRLVEIKNALKDHADPSVVDAMELNLHRTVLKAIALGSSDAVGLAKSVFAVERMKLAQQEADRKAAEEAAAAAAAEAKRIAAVESAKGSMRASGVKVSPNTAADLDAYAQGGLSVYELRKRALADRLRGQLPRR